MNENSNTKNSGAKKDDVRVVEEIVEGFWDCPNCNAKNRGSAQQCNDCGAVRSENVQFYVEDGAKAITDEAELAEAMSGPDWICPFCSNMSPAAAKKCTGCGSDRSAGKNRAVKEIPPGSEKKSAKANGHEPSGPAQPPPPAPLWLKAGCGVFILLFMILTAFSCYEKAVKIEITANSWVRIIERNEYKTVREQAWVKEVPAEARKLGSERKVRSHKEIPDGFEEVDETYTQKVKVGEKQVEDGKVDLGNGRFKIKYKMVPEYKEEERTRRVRRQKFRKEPVYDEEVTYDIERWVAFAPVQLQGATDEPRWPDSGVANNVPPKVGDLSEKSRTENYSVKAKRLDNSSEVEIKELHNEPLTLEQFMKLRVGTTWEAVFSGLGDLRDIKFN